MRLYVLRHGKSPQLLEAGVSRDFDRPLAPEGRAAVKKMVAYLKKQGGNPTLILSSPLARALETAKEAASTLGFRAVEEFKGLDGSIPADDLWAQLKARLEGAREGQDEVLIAGHQPQLGELVAFLTGTTTEIKPGGCVALEFDEERVHILWAMNPKDLE